ncbi:porin family protein [Niabella aquatica]
MKSIQFMLYCVLIGCLNIIAIRSSAQVQIGVRAGVNFSNLTGKYQNGEKIENNKLIPGFHAGVTFDIPVAGGFSVQPGLLFSTKGAQYKDEDDYYKTVPYYAEIPVNFLYKPGSGNGRLLLGMGPYIAYGLEGKWKKRYDGKSEIGKLKFKDDISDDDWERLKDDEDYYGKPLDCGGNLLAGYEFWNNLSIQLNAQFGIANITSKDNGQQTNGNIKNVGFGISLGYKF